MRTCRWCWRTWWCLAGAIIRVSTQSWTSWGRRRGRGWRIRWKKFQLLEKIEPRKIYSKCINKVQGGDGGEGGSKRPKDPMFGQWIKLQMSLNTTMNTTVQESFDEQVVRFISNTLTRQRRSSQAARATFVSNRNFPCSTLQLSRLSKTSRPPWSDGSRRERSAGHVTARRILVSGFW